MASKTTAVIGLTGGIACGKSSVAGYLRGWGAHVIDADAIAREVVMPGEPALAALVRTFGAEILLPDGSLDRKRLGQRVFAQAPRAVPAGASTVDELALAQLNAITHPAILARTGQRLAEAQRAHLGWVVYEAALILENRMQAGLAGLIVVLCPREAQLSRLLARSDLTPAEAGNRVAAQTTDEVRRDAATWIITNDGSLDALEASSRRVFDAIVARHGAPGSQLRQE